jgi:HK97 family phage major capsid protein
MKDYLNKIISSKEARKSELESQIAALQNENDTVETLERAKEINKELRSLGATLEAVLNELNEAKEKLASLEEDENQEEQIIEEERGFNPMGQFEIRTGVENTDKLSTMEYRSAFKDYVQKGIRSEVLNLRADAEQVSTDLGVLLPNTIVNEIIKGVEKVYGQLYTRVKHTNVKGGVQYPVGAFAANLVWGGTDGADKEHGVSEKQKAGSVNSYVSFSYHIGEIRIAQSLLQTIVSVDLFEKEIVNALVEAYVKAMDIAILEGTGFNQPTGVFANTSEGLQRVPGANIISFTTTEMADWSVWKKKLFAKIPLSMRSLKPEFVMTANTYEANIETLMDKEGRPVARELTNPVNGDTVCKFYGKEVLLVEEGSSIKNFDDASSGEYFGIYWVPEKAYAINTNLQFGYKKYFDENTNQYVTKALVIVDGKILDPKYIYLLKKAA